MLRVFDERAEVTVRERIGELLAQSSNADFAIGRIRLAALDLRREEVGPVKRCRVLLGAFDAATLYETRAEGGHAGARGILDATARREQLGVLRDFIRSGRLEVRSAGLAGWVPDFSVIRSDPPVMLLGAHHFGAPYPMVGPSFTVEVTDPAAIALAGARFDTLWEHGHDVLPAIHSVVSQAYEALDMGTRFGGGRPDRP